MKKLLSISLLTVVLFNACKKSESTPTLDTSVKSNLSIEFDNIVGDKDLQLNTTTYTNTLGETFNISLVKYYISNIKLTTTTGIEYVVPQDESYFLIQEKDEDSQMANLSVPVADYKSLTFTVGVDSVRNTMDISKRVGVLDPASTDMYWGWNSGYIFLKIEGTSPQAPLNTTTNTHPFMYHIGGFGGYSSKTINNIKTVTLDLSNRGIPQVRTGKDTNIHLMVNLLSIFNGSTNISFATNPMVMMSDFSVNIANNYASMFTHNHTEN